MGLGARVKALDIFWAWMNHNLKQAIACHLIIARG